MNATVFFTGQGTVGLTASFLGIGVVGAVLIFAYWHKQDFTQAVGRSATFVVLMAVVHFLGYRAWRRQSPTAVELAYSRAMRSFRLYRSGEPDLLGQSLPDRLISALLVSVSWQFGLVVLTGLILDGGVIMRLYLTSLPGLWVGIAMILLHRHARPDGD